MSRLQRSLEYRTEYYENICSIGTFLFRHLLQMTKKNLSFLQFHTEGISFNKNMELLAKGILYEVDSFKINIMICYHICYSCLYFLNPDLRVIFSESTSDCARLLLAALASSPCFSICKTHLL